MHVSPLTGKARRALAMATGQINIWEGSVRSGKTIGSIIAWITYVRTGPAGPLLMVGKTERTVRRNVIDPMTDMLGPRRVRFNSGTGELFLLGRKIHVVGANDERSGEKIRGLTLAGAYVDEVSTIPESFFEMLISRFSVDGARLFGTTNPEGPRHWLKLNYLDRACLWLTGPGALAVYPLDPDALDGTGPIRLHRFSFRLTDNPTLPAGYLELVLRQYTGLWRRRFIDGEWVAADGVIYDNFDTARHVVDALPPIVKWLSVGVDYGTSNPFAAVLLGVGCDNRLYVASEYRYESAKTRRAKTDEEYAADLYAWLATVPIPDSHPVLYGVTPQYVCVDPSAASFTAQLWRDRQLRPTPANNAVGDGIRHVAMLIGADRLRIHSSCRGILDEIFGYVWDAKATEKGMDAPVKRDDHSMDALRYSISTTEMTWRGLLRRPIADYLPGAAA